MSLPPPSGLPVGPSHRAPSPPGSGWESVPMPSVPDYVPAPEPRRRGRRGRLVAGVAVAAVAVVTGAAVTFANLGAVAGGADSPEAAVEALFAAIDDDDLLGVVDTVRPGERDALRDATLPVVDELVRLGVFDTSLDLGALDGVDWAVDGLTLASEPLARGRVAVTVTGGTLTTAGDGRAFPIGPVVDGLVEDLGGAAGGGPADLGPTDGVASTADLADALGTAFVAVEDGGRWYVSLGYTLAEAARRAAGAPAPDPARAIVPVGADSPAAAVEEFFAAALAFDPRRAIAMLAPSEFGALQDYASLYVDALEGAAADATGVTGSFTATDPTVREATGGTVVRFGSATFALDTPDGTVSMTLDDDGCVTLVSPDREERTCPGDPGGGDVLGALGLAPQVPERLAGLGDRLDALAIGVAAVEEDGRWYVSLIRTMGITADDVLAVFEPGDLEALIELVGSIAEDLAGFGLGGV